MATIKAPFNFVPLSDKVYFPEWADQISQDIPFEDGVSGTIELKITAQTPIFVRNGHTKEDGEEKNETYKSFSKDPNGKYFIPGTSIKGCIRNALEILSFGKIDSIDNKRYSIRDLQLKKYLAFFQNSTVHCGWLSIEGEKATITDNGIPRRISHEEIDKKYQTNFCEKFSDKFFLKQESNRSSLLKYKMLKGYNLHGSFRELPLNPKNEVDKRIKVVFDSNGGVSGTIVVTGQPGVRKPTEKNADGTIRKKASGKFYEFVFLDKIENTYTFDTEEENGLFSDFRFNYKDSEEWKYWRNKLEKGEQIPVFFYADGDRLLHFGLSYLYKLPFSGRVKDYSYPSHRDKRKDLSDCIFGMVEGSSALKGRVQFSSAWLETGKPVDYVLSPYLGSPKPTYYPIYLKQNGTHGVMLDNNDRGVFFATMLDKDTVLKGWKKYPVQSNHTEDFMIPDGQDDNTNPFVPISSNSVFRSFVRFHNLKKEELGALLTAIELREGLFHSLGFAKPFGYGRCAVKIENVRGFKSEEIPEFKKAFVTDISKQIADYEKSIQLKEFYTMSRVQDVRYPLEYMDLDDFVSCKKQHFKDDKNQTFGEYLPYYSETIKREIKSLVQQTVVAKAKVTVFAGQIKQAALLEGKNANQSKPLVADKCKLKTGNLIEVEVVCKGGNVEKLLFLKKLS